MLAFEHERAAGDSGMTPDMEIVAVFLDLVAGDPACSLLVLDSKFFRKKRAFGLRRDEPFKVCRLSEVERGDLLKACVSHGHLSVWFVPQNPDELARRFEQLGFYGPGVNIPLGSGQAQDPLSLSVDGAQSLKSFLASDAGNDTRAMFGFSHDAGQFYRVYPQKE